MSLFPPIFCSTTAPAKRKVPHESAGEHHIRQYVASTTPSHAAFQYLADMRSSRGLREHVIDRYGNFVGTSRDEEGRKETVSISEFMPRWEKEWLEVEYNPLLLQRWLLLGGHLILVPSIGSIVATPGNVPEDCFAGNWFVNGILYRTLAYMPSAIGGPLCFLLRFIISRMRRDTLVSLYPSLVITWVLTVYMCVVALGILRELMRDLIGGHAWELAPPSSLCAQAAHVSVLTNFSTFPPSRTCLDRDPVRTVTAWPFVHSVGCGSMLLDATFPR